MHKYGWAHQKSVQDYPDNEMSFRQMINAAARSDRGFCVKVDRQQRKVAISFDSNFVDVRHKAWLSSVMKRVGMNELEPQPYWGFDDLFHKVGTKLHNCFFILAQHKKENGVE